MNFSSRTAWDLTENTFTTALRKARAAGGELCDLTVSNPTSCGFVYDACRLLDPLRVSTALAYRPESLGMQEAREAVSRYCKDFGCDVSPTNVCLTTSTSEAYSFLFRLLCEPGDEVLIARPSYPLFDFIARLDTVRLLEYPLFYDHGWHIDFHALKQAVTPRTRAVVVVHPNNPTGNFSSEGEREALVGLCAELDLALIVDEVFLDYSLPGERHESFAAGRSTALTFVLSGISKVCALPQMKLSWIATCGPEKLVRVAMERLEVIADTFLSVNAPMQHALPFWLAERGEMQGQIRARTRKNLAALDGRLEGTQADRLALQGGWTSVVRVPRYVNGEAFAEAALLRGVLVQPGEFYGLPEGRVVLSLLTPPEIFERGLSLLPID